MASSTRETRRAARPASERSRSSGRNPAIYRGQNASVDTGERPAPQQVNNRSNVPWRLFSGLIVASLIILLAVFFATDVFYVHSVSVGGLEYLNDREVFALSGIAGVHIFWIDPQQVRQNLLQSPSIADAQVNIGWGSPMVQLIVEEREPALVWEQAGIATWVDVNGRVMRQRADRRDLLRISADTLMDGPPGASVSTDVIAGALQLQTLLPDLHMLRYHPDFGLGFNDSRGWEVWLGIGSGMPEKLALYGDIIEDAVSRGVTPRAVYIINPDRPWISTF